MAMFMIFSIGSGFLWRRLFVEVSSVNARHFIITVFPLRQVPEVNRKWSRKKAESQTVAFCFRER
jgi:hypothetical protein